MVAQDGRTRPSGGGCAALTRLGGRVRIWQRQAGGEPCRLRLAPPAIGPRGVPLAPRQGVGRGVGGAGSGKVVGVKEPQDFGGMTKSCRARPAGGGHAFGAPAGRARQDYRRREGGEPYRLRPAPSAIGPRDVPLARRWERAGFHERMGG